MPNASEFEFYVTCPCCGLRLILNGHAHGLRSVMPLALKDEGPRNGPEPLAGVEERGAARATDSTQQDTPAEQTDTSKCPRCNETYRCPGPHDH